MLGVYSARSAKEAYELTQGRIPQSVLKGRGIEADPEGFGLWVYRLAKEGE